MIALYDYTPSTDSPNPQPELELQFTKGQILTIYGDMVSTFKHMYIQQTCM